MPRSTSLSMSQEKRRHLRVELNIPVKISCDDGDILTETKNLSCSGAFCCMTQRLEPMTKLKIYLLLPPKKIVCQGVGVRTQAAVRQDYYDTAIFFSSIAPKDSRTINEFVENMMESRSFNKN